MTYERFFSDNNTGTMADPLKAVGAAEVLKVWLACLKLRTEPIVLLDRDAYYEIKLPVALQDDAVERIQEPFAAGNALVLASGKQQEKADKQGREPLRGYDYDRRQQQRNDYWAAYSKLGEAERALVRQHAPEFAHIWQMEPDPDLPLYAYINHFKIADGYNALIAQWHGISLEAFRANLRLFLRIFGSRPNALEDAEIEWDELARHGAVIGKSCPTALQAINPASGKGGNSPKANGLGIGNLDSFWLLEYLKFVGLFTLATPVMVSDSKDRKTYVLHPTNAHLELLERVVRNFRSGFSSSTAIKVDVLAALQFTERLLEHLLATLSEPVRARAFLAQFRRSPIVTDVARGFDMTFYMDMGSAYATMNLATINLPGWLTISTSKEAEDALAFLGEHERVIFSIKQVRRVGGVTKEEEGSEEVELLKRYRDFLSGQDILCFFDFAARYGDYVLAKRHRNQRAAQLTTDGMEKLMAQPPKKLYASIVEDEGFREIAAVIRQATVVAQYWGARESGYPYEVRYGLGQDLLRAAAYPDNFLAALGTFIQSFNAENARIDERIAKGSLSSKTRRRGSVRTDHIASVMRLMDEFGSEVVCKILVAYGYARDPYTPSEGSGSAPVGVAAEE